MPAVREKEHCEASSDKVWEMAGSQDTMDIDSDEREIGGSRLDARAAPSLQPADESPEVTESNILPPSGYDIDQLNYHIGLQEFGRGLQLAANAVFSNTGDRRSRYTKVSAILLSWEDEDPNLPVSLEIESLRDVFINLYGFEVEEWRIPDVKSHTALNLKILQFLDDSDAKHLKIVYYAGHGKLSNHGQAIWTSHRNSKRDRQPTVKWSGIQNALEESQSDVLVLLDCCASGLSNTDEGNGVTELLAACAFNNSANGVGPFSFTHALISQLRILVNMPSFTVGYLYNLLFTEIQGLPVKAAELRKPPIHLVLTQDHRLPRSITLSTKRPPLEDTSYRPGLITTTYDSSYDAYASEESGSSLEDIGAASSLSPSSSDVTSSATSVSQLPEYPRLLFSIRISEDIKPGDLSTELLTDWLSTLPIEAKSIRIEAGFASDSTLLIVSMPIALLGYMPYDPAITLIGTTRSNNQFSVENKGIEATAALTSEEKKSSQLLDKEREQEFVKIKTENGNSNITTPNLSRAESFTRLQSTEPVKSSQPADTNVDFNHAMKIWDDHLVKIKSSSQLNSIYNNWSMTKLEIVAKSVFTAYKLKQQNEHAELLAQGVEQLEAGFSSPKVSFNKKKQQGFKSTSFQTEMALHQMDSLPCMRCALEGGVCDQSPSCQRCEIAGDNCLRYYAISEDERGELSSRRAHIMSLKTFQIERNYRSSCKLAEAILA
ncbi:hypothetical protein N431DRAFT_421152 [Stipitochalara longipes BDJ]|nr:hypothetical protein N431DRAFT_421152 [Stipitochalara longipes BDJ]